MSSSSIEVMGGGDGQMVLVESDNAGEENIEDGELQTLESAEPSFYSEEMEFDDDETGNDDGFSSLGLPPGSLLFSPQDVASSPHSKRGRGRGRGRGKGPGNKKGTALTIKLEDGVDYSRINLPVACEICGRIMANGKILVQHMTTHVRNKELQCPHCPKSFSKMVQLQGHLVYHGIQKQFECPICHQRFSRQDCVRVHMRLHDKSKCVFCVVCHKAFLTLGALNIHMRIHRGEKPFKCHLCGKCFTQKNHVITHIKRHTKMASNPYSKKLGPRMFQCEHCPRSFIRLSDYERHVQWNHGAVGDNNIMDKQDNENLITDKYSGNSFATVDDFITPSKTLNHKVKKRGFSMGLRRTMCTIGTQTDEEGGRIIIPRKYQNASSMTTSSTQVSAPPTPRPTEEELYENDIFDEGMDRNYSSDDDEDIDDDRKDQINMLRDSEVNISEYPQQTYVSSSSQDDAFDAVLGKSKPMEEFKSASVLENAEECSITVCDVEPAHSDTEKGKESANTPSSESDETSSDPTTANQGKLIEKDMPVNLEFAIPSSSELMISKPESETEPTSSELQQNTITQIKPQESSAIETKQKPLLTQVAQKKSDPKITKLVTKKVNPKIIKPIITQSLKATFSLAKESKIPKIEKGEAEPMIRVPLNESNKKPTGPAHVQHHAKILDTFNTKNWKGRTQGRVRGRGRVKGVIGLTGATHLRLIRKSMMNFISEKVEEMNEKEKEHKPIQKKIPSVEKRTSKAAKRQSKTKQHGADFVCDLRSCETCRPNQTQESTEDSSSDIEMSENQPQTSQSSSSSAPKDQSQKLLQFLISGDASNLHGTEFRLLNEIKPYDTSGTKRDVDNASIYVPSAATIANLPSSLINQPTVRDRIKITNYLHDKNEFFSAIASAGEDIISPPVELQAFCIPTYSCKLCGREFRFEGKLHRHIEAVHQKKEIFSPDVRPGRGPSKYIEYEGTDLAALCRAAEEQPEAVMAAQNPDIEALRSEWDDDDEEDEDEDGDVDVRGSTAPVSTPSTSSQNIGNQASSSFQRRPQLVMNPIITREIVATTNTVTDVYIQGVRMNINKLTGLADNTSSVEFVDNYYIKKSNLSEEVTPVPTLNVAEKEIDTLDSKCRRLLEKLFDHDLLIQCGLYEEHVSVVLGRILQHYGVKMIEDYGQGQYEVLKYNLWRLIEWKVTMEQMEEFYTEGKSVEEMMDDIMNGRVPIIAHHELMEERSEHDQVNSHSQENQIEAVQISDGHLVLSQVANVLSGQLNLGEGVTQVVLAQDVSPELLQGAHIVTIDPTTGQVLSQVTADQVILADSVSDGLGQQIQTINGQVVVTEGQTITVTSLPPGSIVSNNSTSTTVQFSHISEDGQILDPSIEQSRIQKLPDS